jgi:hypothetical protein
MISKKWYSFLSIFCMAAMLFLPNVVSAAHPEEGSGQKGDVVAFEGQHDPVWHIKGKRPFLIGGYGDNFNYDGSRVSPMLGKAKVAVDSVKDSGAMVVKLIGTINPEKGKSYTGKIEIYYRITKGGPAFKEGGVADFIYLHGDTKQGPPVMPKVRTFLASWGPADIYVNGELVYKDLDGHMMYTERSRDPVSQAIYNKDKSGFYSPKKPADSSIADPNGRELHFVAHSHEKDKGNFPPHSVWIHVNFEKAIDLTDGFGHGCRHGIKCGPGCQCGCLQGGPCSCGIGPAKCGPGCDCGCLAGGPCGCMTPEGTCGPDCQCGCKTGGPCGCDKAVGKCGPGCGCGCLAGGPCSCR